MWAAMKDHELYVLILVDKKAVKSHHWFLILQQLLELVLYSAVERLIEKEPSLVNAKKSDGYTALHIAAVNDHQDSANILILKVGKCFFSSPRGAYLVNACITISQFPYKNKKKILQECNIFFKVLTLVALATHPFQYSIMKAKRLHYYAYWEMTHGNLKKNDF